MSQIQASLSERLHRCYTGIVQDVLCARGLARQYLPHDIVPLADTMRLSGPVFTLSGEICEDADPHETLLLWTEFLSKAPAGCVVVCQPNDSSVSHMGELSAETLSAKGVAGYIADGGCRDSEFIRRIGFPLFCRYRTPADIVGRWKVNAMQEPIRIGEVMIDNGDYVLGDLDGVIVIPQDVAAEVIAAAEVLMNTESLVRTAIRDGVDPQQAYLEYGKF